LILGFGSVGKGVLPLLAPVLGVRPGRITIVAPDGEAQGEAAEFDARVIRMALAPHNLEHTIAPLLGPGDFLLNASVHVSSVDLIRLCRRRGALYLDTCTEPWLNHYDNANLTLSQRSNYALREEVLAWGRANGH